MPSGIVSTGWPAVEAKCAEFGDEFDEWQRGAGRLILGKRADGIYAATIGGITLSIPRQVAKTFLVGRIVFALCCLFPGLKVVWTAHRSRTATQTFQKLQGLAKRRKVAPNILYIRTANGEQEIAFANGSVIMFGAREAGFGRGFDEVDVEVFDEAQILGEKALDDMIAATNQSRHPHGALLFYMGTPPKPTDPGEVFTERRKEALAGELDDAVYIECSADPNARPDDQTQWARANPSFPHRTPLRSMLRLRRNLKSDESWLREGLGVWDDVGGGWRVIPRVQWLALVDEASTVGREPGQVAFAVEMSWDRTAAAIGVCGRRADGLFHVEIPVDADGRSDYRAGPPHWLPPRLKQLVDQWRPARVVVNGKGPAGTLIADIEALGVEVYQPTHVELGQAFGRFSDTVEAGGLRHLNEAALSTALAGAASRKVGDAVAWDMKEASTDSAPLIVATNALWGLATAPAPARFFASYR